MHARFLGGKNGKNHKKAAERIDDANYVRVFFLGYENSKKARRLAGFSYLGGTGMDMLLTLLHKKRSSGAYPLATMVMGLLAPFTQPLLKRVCEHEPQVSRDFLRVAVGDRAAKRSKDLCRMPTLCGMHTAKWPKPALRAFRQ